MLTRLLIAEAVIIMIFLIVFFFKGDYNILAALVFLFLFVLTQILKR